MRGVGKRRVTITRTSDVQHRVNQRYEVVLVLIPYDAPHVRVHEGYLDWMPTDEELKQLVYQRVIIGDPDALSILEMGLKAAAEVFQRRMRRSRSIEVRI